MLLSTVDNTITSAIVERLKPACGTMQIQSVTYDEFYLPKSISKCQ